MMLPFWFEAFVMSINAAFGAAIARNRKLPIFATLLAGLLVGLGGGMLRDVLLGLEPIAITKPLLIPLCIGTGIVGALLFDRIVSAPKSLLLLQGFVWGTLVTIGAQKALNYDAPVVSAVLLGLVTATFGGVIADAMAGQHSATAKQAQWLALALTVGAVVFVVASITIGFWPAVVLSVIVSTVLRYVSQARNWQSPHWPGQSRKG